jgi:Asp-tRNA(Asn)/Glu-tRNA(Gln) amidotransferase A subunit family amidase
LHYKKISSIDLLEAYFAQVEKLNAELNVVIWQDREVAREAAWQKDREKANG